jgi:DNA polymerase-3 subunit beta
VEYRHDRVFRLSGRLDPIVLGPGVRRMKIQCERKKLSDAFQTVSALIPPRSVKPVLQHVKLLADKAGLELWATDLEIAIRYRLEEVEVEQEGIAVVPAAKMSAILRETVDEKISLDADNQICNVKGSNSFFKLLGWEPEEFPEIPSFQEEEVFEIPASGFRDMIRKSMFAAAREKTRYALNGVLFRVREGTVEMVGTDGRRLARQVLSLDAARGLDKKALLPSKGLAQVDRLLGSEDEVIRLDFEENMVVMKTRKAELSVRQVDGAFPDYEEVIPKDRVTRVNSKAGDFCAALRRAAIMTSDDTRSVRLEFADNRAVFVARAADVGEAKVELDVAVDGKDQEVSFNPDFLIEGLRVLPEDAEFHLDLNDKSSPGKITCGEGYTYVIMPINLDV